MKFCPECGAKLVSQKFCAECGEGVGGLGSFDFFALGADTQAQLQEQMRYMADFDIQDGVLVKYKGSESNVVIPNSATGIGRDAFSLWGSHQTIYIPSDHGWKNTFWTSAKIIEY